MFGIKLHKSFFLIAVLAIIWGSSFIMMKRGLEVYTPYQVGALRIFVSMLCLLPFIIKSISTAKKLNWKYLAATGLLANGIPSLLFPLAETNISSALAGMINTLTPVFTLLVSMILFGVKPGRNRVIGLSIGLIGAIILILGKGNVQGAGGNPAYAWYVVIATVCYALSVNIIRHKLADVDPVRTTGFSLLCVGIPMGIYLFSTDFIHRTNASAQAGSSLINIVLLGMLSTAFSSVLFNRLIKTSGALFASSVTYLIPVVATLWGLWDHESLGFSHVIGLSAILAGVYMINRKTA